MTNEDILFFSNKPLPQTETLLNLDLRSSYDSRGEDTALEDSNYDQAGLLEGHVFFDPAKIEIFSIVPELETLPPFFFGPDRKRWDLYLMIIPFTLQDLSGNDFYKHVKFCIKLVNKGIQAFDLFPRNIFTDVEGEKGYTISIHGRFQEIDDDQLNIGRQLRFAPLQPKISAFDNGKYGFYWVYEGANGEGKVEAETKHVLAILRAPRGVSYIEGNAYCQTRLQKTRFGIKYLSPPARTKDCAFQLKLSDLALFRPTQRNLHTESAVVADPHFDVCLVCALPEEARALKEVLESLFHAEVLSGTSSHPRREYYHTTLKQGQEALSLQISWLPKSGPGDTSLLMRDVLTKFRPQFVGMTGICAGDKRKVKLGDLIVARQAFNYEVGKVKQDRQGQPFMEPRLEAYSVPRQVIQAAINFEDWKLLAQQIERPISKRQQREWLLNKLYTEKCSFRDIPLDELKQHMPLREEVFNELLTGSSVFLEPDGTLKNGLPIFIPYRDPAFPEVHSDTVASGAKVRADDPFARKHFAEVSHPIQHAIAIDMEGAAFYHAMADENMPFLFVKGVSDYADTEKDDTFHIYAARLSALYMLSFIQHFAANFRVLK